VWMDDVDLVAGKQFDIKFSSLMTQGAVSKVHHRVDVNTMEQHPASDVKLNEIALCELTLTKPVSFDPYHQNPATGAFIIIDRLTNVTVGAGMVVGEAQGGEGDTTAVSAEDKAKRFGQQPAIIAINGSNPEVTAKALDRRLFEMGKAAAIASNEQALILKEAGLIALVAGGADDATISLAADEDDLDSMIATLQEKGIV
jgi:sulfate adenylyltransferase subunit 1 (EFTu-like GTPase family)